MCIRDRHHLVYEIVDNSIDEALAGYCDSIEVTIHKDNSITVTDNGRGMPVGMHPKMGKPTVEVIMTVLHAGGKFGGGGYKVSGGLHGVGASVVNALSSKCIVTVKRDGHIWRQSYERGAVVSDLEIIGDTNEHGTTVDFMADDEIFETTEYQYDVLSQRLRELAFLNKGIKMCIRDRLLTTLFPTFLLTDIPTLLISRCLLFLYVYKTNVLLEKDFPLLYTILNSTLRLNFSSFIDFLLS